jgi:predicted metal-binding protein
MCALPATEVLVCIKCRRGTDVAADERRPGAHLLDHLTASELPNGVTVRGVECLSNCDHGCSVALRGGPARWTYIYGNLHEVSHLDALIDGVQRYHASADGLIPWRERPEHFRKNCVARIPPLEPENV